MSPNDDIWIEWQARLDKLERELNEVVRPRVHELASNLGVIQLQVKEITVLLSVNREEMRHLRDTTATRDQVDSGIRAMTDKLDNFHQQNTLKIENITSELAPIKRAMWWAVLFLASGVGAAVLNLVIKK